MNDMNAHDRIIKALNHEEPDRVPTFSQSIEVPFRKAYMAEVGLKQTYGLPGLDYEIAKDLKLDSKWNHHGLVRMPIFGRPKIPHELKEKIIGRRVNNVGHIHAKNSFGEDWYVDGILKTPELLTKWIEYIKHFKHAPMAFYKKFKEQWQYSIDSADFVMIPTAGGPIFDSIGGIGLDRLAYMMRKHPQLVKDLIMAFTKVTKEDHERFFELGIDAIFVCDDHAFKNRTMLSPKQFEEFIEPAYKILANNAHKYDAKFLVHSDGDLSDGIPSYIRAGVDAIEPLEYESGMRLNVLKEKYGDKMAFIGNVPSSDVLSFGNVEETIKITKQCILDAAEGGGYVLAPGSNIIGTAKWQNVKAMVETVHKYGTYPIQKEKLKQ
jgi:uroporphyrinogen decarboxylase